jgi:regulatory protein
MPEERQRRRPRGRHRTGPPAQPMLLSEIVTEHPLSDGSALSPQSPVLNPENSAFLRVTAIERQQRRGRYNIFVDGEFALALEPEILATSGLRVDAMVTPERLRELSVGDMRKRTLDAALHLLAARPRSEAEVRGRLLRRGLPHDIIADTLARLRELGYVNDTEFARFWVESRSGANPRGRYVVRRELRAKGVDDETAATAMEALTDEASARQAAGKKARSLKGLEYPAFRGRLAGYLVRRGFDYDTVRRIVDDLWRESGGNEPDASWEPE